MTDMEAITNMTKSLLAEYARGFNAGVKIAMDSLKDIKMLDDTWSIDAQKTRDILVRSEKLAELIERGDFKGQNLIALIKLHLEDFSS